MLKHLRSRKVMRRVMLWTIVLITPPFVFYFGWQSSSGRGAFARQELARVKDRWWGLRWRMIPAYEQQLHRETLQRRYARLFNERGFQMQPEWVRNLVDAYDIAREAIDAYFLRRLAHQKGLDVTLGEIRALLEEAFPVRPAESFRQFLMEQGKSESQFIEELAYRRTLGKARAYIAARAKASLFELWQEYRIGQEKIQIRYVRIPASDFEDKVEVTTASLLSYYQDHAEQYRVGDKARFRYVAVFRSDIEKQIEPTTDSLLAYYEKHKEDQFKRPRSVRVRHILLKVAQDAPTTVVKAVEKKISDIAAKIKAGADFAEMADRFSEDESNIADPKDPSKKRGGLLLAPVTETLACAFGDEFKRAALALEQDQVSSPVRSPVGFHLIKADRVTTAGILAFDQVKNTVRRIVKQQMVDEEFRKRGEQLKALFRKRAYSTLDSFAKAAGLPIEQTGLVDLESGRIDKIGSIRDYLDLVKQLSEGEFTEGVLKNNKAYFVLELKRKVPSHIPPFEEVVDEVRSDYVTSQAIHLAHQVAAQLRREAKSLDDLVRLAEERGLEVKQTEPFARNEANTILPNIDPRFARATLRYKVGTIHVTKQGDPERPMAYIVWYYEKREPPSLEQFRKDLPTVRADYLRQIEDALVEEWLYDMRHRYRAEINPAYQRRPEQGEESG